MAAEGIPCHVPARLTPGPCSCPEAVCSCSIASNCSAGLCGLAGAGPAGTAGSPAAQPPHLGQSWVGSPGELQAIDPALSKRASLENVPVVTRAVVGM